MGNFEKKIHRHYLKNRARGLILCLLAVLFVCYTWEFTSAKTVNNAETDLSDLTELSLEDLMNIEVVSVSKKAQKLSDAAAAISVITQEDIRRSGANSVPEALRLVPGLQVAQIDSNKWAIGCRGFGTRFTNKLLVLMDGRTIYTPLYSGVFWDAQDTVLEDIDRIEVIRGPGATMWGANAVNGVINIVTKNAGETQGTLVSGGGGSEDQVFGTVRYGGKIDEDSYYRIYAKYLNRDDSLERNGDDAADEGDMVRAGIRLDWKDSFTLLGEIFEGDSGDTINTVSLLPPYTIPLEEDVDTGGGFVLLRWNKSMSVSSDVSVQFYYDRFEYDVAILGTEVDTFDFDFQHRFSLGEHQEIIWGIGYRYIQDEINNTIMFSLTPDSEEYDLMSAFIQDEISFLDNKLRLTIGSKFEHNDFTGFEIQPSIRALWAPMDQYSVWASISRAVRTPNRVEDGLQIDAAALPPGSLLPGFPGAGVIRIFGNEDLDSEDLVAFELGFRTWFMETLSVDISVYYNIYDNLRDGFAGVPSVDMSVVPPVMILPGYVDNNMDGKTFGIELAADYRPLDWWRLKTAYTYLAIDLNTENGSTIGQEQLDEGSYPHNQVALQSTMDLNENLELDLQARYVDSFSVQNVDSYIAVDARVAWKPTNNFEMALVGKNLFDRAHPEFEPQFLYTTLTEVERSVYFKITLFF